MGSTLNRSIIFNHAISWFVPLVIIGGGMLFYSLINHFGFLFNSTYEQYKAWYPTWHFFIFIVLRVSPFICLILIFFLTKFICLNIKELAFNLKKYYFFEIRLFVLFAILTLILFLLIYYVFKLDFSEQLYLTRIYVSLIYFQIVLTSFLNSKELIGYFKAFLFKSVLPYNLAIFRIILYSYFIVFYLGNSSTYFNSVASGVFTPMPIFGSLFYYVGSSLFIYKVFFYACIVAFLGVVIGYKTRFFLIFSSIFSLFVISTPNMFGTSWHHHLFMWIPWFFTFSYCYDVFSVDYYLSKNKSIYKKSNYNFTIRIIWIQIGLLYWCAGVNKLWDSGFDWALSQSMINQFHLEWFENFDKIPSIRVDKYPILLHVGGMLAIIFEMLFFFLLFKKSTRIIAIIGGLLMHNILGYFLHIAFFGTLQVLYLIFIDWNYFFKDNNSIPSADDDMISKWSVRFGIVLVSINLFFGIASIQTYPFSGYPEYSDIIPNYTYQLKFQGFQNKNEVFDNSEFSKYNFDWETYRRREQKIADKYLNNIEYEKELISYWRLISEHINLAKKVDSLNVYLDKVYLNPDSLNRQESQLIGTYLSPSNKDFP